MTKVTNNENMRRYVHMALAKQASQAAGGGLSAANLDLGFRCFNIIQDDGTVI